MRRLAAVVVLLLAVLHGKQVLTLEVNLPGLGTIDGTTTTSFMTHKTIYQYKGIPYAQPPIGDLRFKRPLKWVEPWNEVRNMSQFGAVCPQNTEGPLKFVTQDEDCLTLNVYTKTIEDGGVGSGLPVMVYIHGGSFRLGSARGATPEYLLDEEVVLVAVQYRLGPLGFLSLKNEEMPGNQGMLDVVLALEWVRDNIQHFGGDPSRVTIFGQSAGGAAVTSLLFSPLAKDLFHGVIPQSGTVLGTWATDPDPIPHTYKMAELASCSGDDAQIVVCLLGKPYQEILDAHTEFLIWDISTGGRAVGGNHIVYSEAGSQSFMPASVDELMRTGQYMQVPMMAGVTKHEGSWFVGNIWDLFLKNMSLSEEEMRDFMDRNITQLVLDYSGIHDTTGFVESSVRDKYFTQEQLGSFQDMIPGLMDIMGVALLKASSYTLARHMSVHAPTYFYSFNFFGRHTTFEAGSLGNPPFTGGVAHSDELYYLFPLGKMEILDDREKSMVKTMVQLWTSFATTHAPVTDKFHLPRMSTYEGPYVKINTVSRVLDNFIDEEYTIAGKEGITEVSAASSVVVSLLTVVPALWHVVTGSLSMAANF